MRLIRLILIDLTLMLLVPGNAEATIRGAGATFTSATKTVASLERISAPELILSSGASRQPSCQTSQAAQFQLATNTLAPAKPAEHSTMLELGPPCVIGKRAGQRPIATINDGPEMLNKPLVVTPSICNAAAARYGLLGAETPRWSGTDWIVGGMVIAAILLAILVERYTTGAGT
ncbi:hypothetical protein ACVIGB_008191 [Bradyrhizobium sp. USDA 4341]